MTLWQSFDLWRTLICHPEGVLGRLQLQLRSERKREGSGASRVSAISRIT